VDEQYQNQRFRFGLAEPGLYTQVSRRGLLDNPNVATCVKFAHEPFTLAEHLRSADPTFPLGVGTGARGVTPCELEQTLSTLQVECRGQGVEVTREKRERTLSDFSR
jgi:hypothetical protein